MSHTHMGAVSPSLKTVTGQMDRHEDREGDELSRSAWMGLLS